VHFVSAGAGAPPLVLVHGFACSHADWKFQLEALAKPRLVLACDLRGHGATPGRPAECTIENFGGDLAALAGSLALPPAILVGHSMGCRVVLEAARIAPERVAGLVLVDGSCIGSGDPDAAERDTAQAIRVAGYRNFARKLFQDMFVATSDPRLRDETVERALQLPEQIGSALFPRLVAWDARNMERALSGLRAPLMVIQSTTLNAARVRVPLERGQTSPWLDMVRRLVPAARIEIVPGVGHFPQLEAPGQVSRLIEDFAQKP
jgi:pimeloyl-ACP methyl ester carboxylesterase